MSETKPDPTLFLGCITKPRDDWASYFGPLVPPSSYSPKRQATWLQEKEEKRALEAGKLPFAATVVEFVILNMAGGLLQQYPPPSEAAQDSVEVGAAGWSLLASLTAFNVTPTTNEPCGSSGVPVYLFGLGIYDSLRVAACDTFWLNAKLSPAQRCRVSPSLWYHRTFHAPAVIDPYQALVRTAQQDDMPLEKVCAYLGVEMPADFGTSPLARAELARQLTVRMQLTGSLDRL